MLFDIKKKTTGVLSPISHPNVSFLPPPLLPSPTPSPSFHLLLPSPVLDVRPLKTIYQNKLEIKRKEGKKKYCFKVFSTQNPLSLKNQGLCIFKLTTYHNTRNDIHSTISNILIK